MTVPAHFASDPPGGDPLDLQDQLAKITESVPGTICSYQLHADGRVTMPYTARSGEELYGFSREELARDFSVVLACIHPDDAGRVGDRLAQAARDFARWHDCFRYLHPQKGLRWIEGWSVPRREPDGSILWHGFVMDVTERMRAEEALRESDQRKSEFLATLSHELRNPLAPVRNALWLLQHAAPGSDQAVRAREVIERQTQHLTRLVDDLLDVNRISRGKIALRRARLELGDLVRRTCEDHRTAFEQRGIEVQLSLPPAPVWVDADATRLAQIVGNLLQNAAKFTGERGHVWIAVALSAGRREAEIRVRDDGVGLSPDLLPRVFEPFVQAETGLARTLGGLGLGLALVKGLAEQHGGAVRAASPGPGQGAEFTVTLPLAEGPPEAARPPEPAAVEARPLQVLIVEDNPDSAETLLQILELLGHAVRVAHDGRAGLALARAWRPDVVLCDIGLPDLDGYELARALRADPALRGMRLVALSGYAQPEDRERALEAGFDAHLGKPAPPDAISEALGAPPGAGGT
ncbi:hybrid sensor histidine kinase/response regulator [Anaeromyxobacter paludicola]|uniref:histidine kinase n=1 Tax=Anaeromyxobacter paludicola TaxID=2918171 RepID=A0ABM7XAW1_9BACT|nr:ATP-binding protein [Anaeromyxobacter paludicola]BDG08969.1 hypothetical protein AMPC_20820 [Anaeromyxobacter paludicola]